MYTHTHHTHTHTIPNLRSNIVLSSTQRTVSCAISIKQKPLILNKNVQLWETQRNKARKKEQKAKKGDQYDGLLCGHKGRCNTLQHTATQQHDATVSLWEGHKQYDGLFCGHIGRCNTLQHTATHCNTMQQHPVGGTQAMWRALLRTYRTMQHTATHCNNTLWEGHKQYDGLFGGHLWLFWQKYRALLPIYKPHISTRI